MPTDYSRGKIYCLRSPHTDKVYIGSTCEPYLSRRLVKHRGVFKRWKKDTSRPYVTSFVILECGDAYIELLELYPCSSRDELHAKEGEYMRKMKCVNRCIAGRGRKQYREDNKEELRDYAKQYRDEHKEKIREERNKKFSCPCGGRYTHRNKSAHFKSKNHQEFLSKKDSPI